MVMGVAYMALLRKPRVRSPRRNVAPLGYVIMPSEREAFTFTEMQVERLLAAIATPGSGRRDDRDKKTLVLTLSQLAAHYKRWKQQPHPPRSEARSELVRLADLASRQPSLDEEEQTELRSLIYIPNDTAQIILSAALLSHPRWPRKKRNAFSWITSDRVDWTIVAEAAGTALKSLKRGDYPDYDLSLAVQTLVDSYEGYVGRPADLKGIGTLLPPALAFVRTFFAIVDPDLPERSIDNRLDQILRARRKRPRARARAQSFRPAF